MRPDWRVDFIPSLRTSLLQRPAAAAIRYGVFYFLPVELHDNQLEWQTTRRLVQSYKALVEIVKEDPSAERVTDPNAVRERQFIDEYLDEGARSAKSMRLKRRILEGSRRYLEQLYV